MPPKNSPTLRPAPQPFGIRSTGVERGQTARRRCCAGSSGKNFSRPRIISTRLSIWNRSNRVSNRSHRNQGHIGMNALRKKHGLHASEKAVEDKEIVETVHAVRTSDCVKLLAELPSDSVQLIVCDPPYNISVAE